MVVTRSFYTANALFCVRKSHAVSFAWLTPWLLHVMENLTKVGLSEVRVKELDPC